MSEYIKWLNEQIESNRIKMRQSKTSTDVHYGRASAFGQALEKYKEIESQQIDKMGEHYGEK